MKFRYLLIFQLCIISASGQQISQPVRLKNGAAVPGKNIQPEKNIGEALRPVRYKNSYYTLIQFSKLPSQQERQALRRDGIILYGYIPQNAFLAEIKDSFTPRAFKKHNISSVFTLEPSAKLASGLLQQLTERTIGPDQFVAVHFFGSVDKATAIAELQRAGAQVAVTRIQPADVVFVSAASTAVVQKIAELPFVAFISSQYLKDIPINYNNRAAHSASALSATVGRNLQGSNVSLGIGDNADVSTHLDFSGRLVNRVSVPSSTHGTHTAGTMAGAGLVNPKHTGMAPRATIINQFFSDILVNTPFYVADHGMVLTNNSYYSGLQGCPGQGDYDVLSNYVDAQMNSDPALLHVFAAGNDGGYTCSPYPAGYATIKSGFQCGKNVLTVGSIYTLNNSSSSFSSRGPVDDGRIKPEIVAGGSNIMSTTPNNNYGASSGTSMAAPTVTGTLALLYERYRQLHQGQNPSAALIKAITCNSADDLGNPGPDFVFGFGNLNARNAVEAIEGNHYFISGVSNGGTITHTLPGVAAGAEQVKVMLYWNDPAAAPYATNTLVNNLDLTVTAPDGSLHYPLVLNPNASRVTQVAAERVDNTNNIEQVVINNPPSGNFTIKVSGTDIPSGQQEYIIVYQVVRPSVTVEYPFGEESLVPGEQEMIRWSAYGSNNNSFTVEYSLNGGTNWTTISNNVPAASRSLAWTVPNLPTTNALIRVTRNGAGYTDVSDYNFTILGQPTLTVTNTCPGYAQLSWAAVSSATGYEIMVLKGNDMQPVAVTAGTSYLLGGLNKDSLYWLSVRAINGSVPGRRSIAKSILPSGGTCPSPTFDNDLTPYLLVAPVTGRMHTLSQLNVVAPRVQIRNLGSVASSGSFTISYQVNGGSIITENSTQSIVAGSSYTYTFTVPYDLSAPGTYRFKVWVDYGSDGLHQNDTLISVIKHLQNDALVLNPFYIEGFESAGPQSYFGSVKGFEGVDRCDFNTSNGNGRARTFVNTAFAHTGNRAITLDQKSYSTTSSADSLVTTFNLSNYSNNDQLRLDYYFSNHGIDFSVPGNQVWIRGSENDAWIPVFTLPVNNPNQFGKYQAAPSVNITEILSDAVPAQTVSSSFQVRFGQQGYTSANSVISNGNLDDGFTFDDVKITLAVNDVSVKQLINPSVNNVCARGSEEPVAVQIKNYSASTLNNVSVSYSVNGNVVSEIIPSLAPDEQLVFTFAQKADLSAYQSYTLKTWVNYAGDNYTNNDTLTHVITTVPVITRYPYLENFEPDNGKWYTEGANSSWQWGAPNRTIINKAANGSRAWITNPDGAYNNAEHSYLYSPCFDLRGLSQPVISFSHIFQTEDNCDCDYHWIEYSNDGITWQKLGQAAYGTNWYDDGSANVWRISNTRWHVSAYDIPSTAGSVRFRFVMKADPAVVYEGVGIDDIHIFDKAAIYNGANIPGGITKTVNDSNWVHFDVNGKRIASVNSHGQNLGNTTVKLFINTGQVRNNGYQYYLDRNIVIQSAVSPAKPVSVRYYFTDTEINNLINATGCVTCHTIADAYEAGVTQYSSVPAQENGAMGDNDSGTYHFVVPAQVEVMPYDNGYYAEFQVNYFSEFWINSGGPRRNQAVPQIVDSFRVTKNDATALLQWVTFRELNTGKFIVQESADSILFTDIGTVSAAGNSSTMQQYQFTDQQLVWGINYYRLKTVNADGKVVYSPVRTLLNDGHELKIVDSFRVSKNNDTALLQWVTIRESNTDKFIIERSSDDFAYTTIGELPASGNSTSLLQYQFSDTQLLWGLNYYRIKTVNTIGQFIYSQVRSIDNPRKELKAVDSFRVTKNGETALLQWTTLQEFNTSKFVVEKSVDDIFFTTIGEINAAGFSTTPQHYQFTDGQLLGGLNFYRIKTVDVNGEFVYSPVRTINNVGNKLTVDVFPNPVKKRLLNITASVDCRRLELRDISGRMVVSLNVQGKQNQLMVHHVPKGLYFLTVVTDAGKRVERVVIE